MDTSFQRIPTRWASYPLTPCRVADTRNATGPLGGPFLTGEFNQGLSSDNQQLPHSDHCQGLLSQFHGGA